MKENERKILRTSQVRIKKGHRLYGYCDELSFQSKNLYNISNFHIRQVITGVKKDTPHENEAEIIRSLNTTIPDINKKKMDKYEKKVQKEKSKPRSKPKKIKKPVQFDLVDKENSFLNYHLLDAYFCHINQVDYRALPAQCNQETIKLVIQAWLGFFELMKLYKKGELEDKPKIPKYAKKDGRKVVGLTNQNCYIKDGKYLKLPKTKYCLNVQKYIPSKNAKLSMVRLVPGPDYYTIELVFSLTIEASADKDIKRVLGIDLGIDNFATIANVFGERPVIIEGKKIKSLNQYYNKEKARLTSVLRKGKKTQEGPFTSNRLEKLGTNRNDKIKDFMHKTSRWVINYALKLSVDTIVIGWNSGIKQGVKMGKSNTQNFVYIPYKRFIDYLEYKAKEAGINLIITEESYTSKASYFDNDFLPVYSEEKKDVDYEFSGIRSKRGKYLTSKGYIVQADVNAALNIIRKVITESIAQVSSGIRVVPIRVNIS